MAMVTYPLDGPSYDAAGAELFHCTRSSGVWAGDDDFDIKVSGADNNITLQPGLAWIRNKKFAGKVVAQKVPLTLNAGLSDDTYERIDSVVIQFSTNKNASEIIIKKGVASSSPVPPARSTTESLYELHLYHIRRRPGAATITMDDITDLRTDEKWCGIMYDDVTPKGSMNFLTQKDKGVAGGVCELDEIKKVPMNRLLTNEKFGIPTLDYTGAIPFKYIGSYGPGLLFKFEKISGVDFLPSTALYDSYALGNSALIVRYQYKGIWPTPGSSAGTTTISVKLNSHDFKFMASESYPMLQSTYSSDEPELNKYSIGSVQVSRNGEATINVKFRSNASIDFKGIFLVPIERVKK